MGLIILLPQRDVTLWSDYKVAQKEDVAIQAMRMQLA